jgi:exopolyphosphatase / guanosine-5'-triphosphate,3'-diphosphate pyrophosphatase
VSADGKGAVAAVDCGTNSTRLLIVDEQGRELARDMRHTRLGEGVHASRMLSEAAIERTVDALRLFRATCDDHGVAHIRVVATSAARDATNSNQFFDAAEQAIGVRPELLDGRDEGLLTFRGATAGLAPAPCLVVDIGGGSTEFVAGEPDGSGVRFARSLDMGVVRLTELALPGDPPTAGQLDDAFSIVEAHLAEIEELLGSDCDFMLVGAAGTVTTLAGMHLGLSRYEPAKTHHHVLSRDDVERLFREISSQTVAERMQNPILPEKRADVIVAGAVILLQVMRQFDFDNCLVSEHDILDGLAESLRSA